MYPASWIHCSKFLTKRRYLLLILIAKLIDGVLWNANEYILEAKVKTFRMWGELFLLNFLFWNYYVRIMTQLLEPRKSNLFSAMYTFCAQICKVFEAQCSAVHNLWSMFEKSTNRWDRRKMSSISEFLWIFKDLLCRE